MSEKMREALAEIVRVIDAAGPLNFSNGVQLGKTSWYVEFMDALASAREALAEQPAPAVPDADKIGQAVSDYFKGLDNGDGTFAFDFCSSDDIDALVSVMLAAAPAPPAPAVPDGWKLVPVEATWQMEEAGSKAGGLGYRDVDNIDADDAARVWEAMLAAAPKP